MSSSKLITPQALRYLGGTVGSTAGTIYGNGNQLDSLHKPSFAICGGILGTIGGLLLPRTTIILSGINSLAVCINELQKL